MRESYPDCCVIGDSSEGFVELCKSLRFSTHCHFVVVSKTPPFEMSDYVYMRWQSNEVEPSKKYFVIRYSDGNIQFGPEPSCKQALMNDLQEKLNVKKIKLSDHSLDFLIDYEGEIQFLGGVCSGALIEQAVHQEIQSIFDKNLKTQLATNQLFTLKLSGSETRLELNKAQPYWPLLRATGINIPLIMIQTLLERKIKTTYFVNPSHITHELCYSFDFDTVYFDLDETLIWKEKPNHDTIKWLKFFYDNNYSVKLITRHEDPIKDTLDKVNINSDMFDEVIKVFPVQKKSAFISGRSIFIDNEFQQRLDVCLNCQIPSLDLDQIDFFELK